MPGINFNTFNALLNSAPAYNKQTPNIADVHRIGTTLSRSNNAQANGSEHPDALEALEAMLYTVGPETKKGKHLEQVIQQIRASRGEQPKADIAPKGEYGDFISRLAKQEQQRQDTRKSLDLDPMVILVDTYRKQSGTVSPNPTVDPLPPSDKPVEEAPKEEATVDTKEDKTVVTDSGQVLPKQDEEKIP